ncbi:hypothetical protein D3Z60_26625 [Lachnospiraceae bacterium]|nr:hypothetical protein [Lachnospiraceae bacterium]
MSACTGVVDYGKEEQYKHEMKVKNIYDDGFTVETSYGYTLPYEYFGKWKQRSWSAGCCYRYVIFLTCDDDIENYLPEVRKEITRRIQNQIENLIGYLKKLA